MTIQEVSANSGLVLELLNTRAEIEPESKFNLGCKPKERELQLIDKFTETYIIDKKKAKAKVVLGHFDNRPNQYFTYALEIVIAPIADLSADYAGQIKIIDCVNDDASSDGGGAYFADGYYVWTDKKRYDGRGIRKESDTLSARSIREVLSECGFNSSRHFSKRKKPCVILINLKCRVIEWLGAKGKTQINTKPFADDIANTVSSLSPSDAIIPWSSIRSSDPSSSEPKGGKQTAIDYLRDWLWDRRKKVEADPTLKTRDRLTQSGVFYRVRRVMIEGGFEPPKDWGITRTTLQNSIMKTCQELWSDENITREKLGIIAVKSRNAL